MEEVTELINQGKISPITPIRSFTASDIKDCFRFFQKGEHIGKVVVEFPESGLDLGNAPILRQQLKFDSDAAYLLVGGLGGLGRAVSSWMAESGARHIVYLSRSAKERPSPTLDDFFDELVAMGCSYQVIQGSVTNVSDVEEVVRLSRRPIRGVLHMAMELNVSLLLFKFRLQVMTPHSTGSKHV